MPLISAAHDRGSVLSEETGWALLFLNPSVFILWSRGVTAGLDYPLLLDKEVTALSGGRLLTFLYLALRFAFFLI